MRQLRLFVLSAETALMNALVPQAEALLRSAVTAAAEAVGKGEDGARQVLERLTSDNEAAFINFVRNLTSLLVVVPGNPEPKKGPMYLLQGLLKVLDDFPWAATGDGQAQVYISLVPLTAALAQERLPYHIA
eukprot:gene26332-32293_t